MCVQSAANSNDYTQQVPDLDDVILVGPHRPLELTYSHSGVLVYPRELGSSAAPPLSTVVVVL